MRFGCVKIIQCKRCDKDMASDSAHVICPDCRDPAKRCERLLDGYLKQLEAKVELTQEEARMAFDIREAFKLSIVTIGDVKNGFPATKVRFQKIVSFFKQKLDNPWKARIIIWDDLVDVINLKGEEVQVIRESEESAKSAYENE